MEVQVRYRSLPERALLTPLPVDGSGPRRRVGPIGPASTFAEPQFSVTPGQAAVFYAGEVVLGGGLIQADG